MVFDNISEEKIVSFHKLHSLMRRLRIIGFVETITSRKYITESGKPIRYKLEYLGYNPKMKGFLSPSEALDEYLSR